MATSSILGGERAPVQPSGRGADVLGPSDSSDSGSDSVGELGPDQIDSDTDRFGTGERPSADLRDSGRGIDILPDHVDRASVGAGEALDIEELEDLAGTEDEGDTDADSEAKPS